MFKSVAAAAVFFFPFVLFSCSSSGPDAGVKAEWISNAFSSLAAGDFPRVKAVSWWHENFDGSMLRIDSSPESLAAYRAGAGRDVFTVTPVFDSSGNKLEAPASGIYHSAFPDFGGTEDQVSGDRITAFEDLAGKEIVWAYFSNNWYDDSGNPAIEFPSDAVDAIHDAGRVPFIRMMPRSNFDEGGPDPVYTMAKIISGDFDDDLRQWARDAAAAGIPLLVEFGTEVNGSWFPWNGLYNGGGTTDGYGDSSFPDGPERFRDAYRHIRDICDDEGAGNITWFFHVDADGEPDEDWNSIANYYPGDDYVDWIGVSVYGPQEKGEEYREFSQILEDVYGALSDLSADKPLAVLEFAVTEL